MLHQDPELLHDTLKGMEKLYSKKQLSSDVFRFPSLKNQIGEIERVANTFDTTNKKSFIEKFMQKARHSTLIGMSEELWKKLENTDSLKILAGDWDAVALHAYHGGDSPRDWQSLKLRMESGELLDAPIVVKIGNKMHLVSGNTRLMVARALGISPSVLLIDMTR